LEKRRFGEDFTTDLCGDLAWLPGSRRVAEITARPAATKLNWPQENAKIAKKKLHKFLSLCSLQRPLPADNGADARRWGEEEFSFFYLRASESSAGKFRIRLRLAALCSFAARISLEFHLPTEPN
jgi:hypothetical protein